jgi:anti-sigma B factor antagonist
MRNIQVQSEQADGRATVRVSGDLDLATADEVEGVMRRVEGADPSELILDLRGLGFIDSTGLRLIISAHARAREGGWGFAIIPGSRRVHRVFQVAGLEDRLPFTEEGR